jgi:predicted DNA-binding protein
VKDYFIDLNALFQDTLDWWLIGGVFAPAFLSIVLGYFVSNFVTYRDQHRRFYEELCFLRRRLFLGPGEPARMPETSGDWDHVVVAYDVVFRPIIFEMQHSGFHSAATKAYYITERIEHALRDARDHAKQRADADVDRFNDGDHHWQDVFGDEMRRRLRLFIAAEHDAMLVAAIRLRPHFLELIDAPNLCWLKTRGCAEATRLARIMFSPLKEFGAWIDRKYAPRRSDCGSCCNNCRRTL